MNNKLRIIIKSVILFGVLTALCLSLIGCRLFKPAVGTSSLYPYYTKEELFRERKLIFKGKILEQGSSAMTNPDNTRMDQYGYQIENSLVTKYTVQIEDLYKGEYLDETIELNVSNGGGLSPDLILYGEDKNCHLKEPLVMFTLEIGKSYIFTLGDPIDAETEELKQFWGYYANPRNTFSIQEDGIYKNSWGDGINTTTVKQEIAAALAANPEVVQ